MSRYAIHHEGKTFLPSGQIDLPAAQVDEYNQAVERSELIEWTQQPSKFLGYITGNTVSTWLGTTLGTVYRSNTYRNNLGVKIRSIAMRGNNGASYYGRYGEDWSQLVRLRKMK